MRLLALDRSEGQGFASDPAAVEVNVGAVAAGQYNVALVEFRDIDLQAARATRKERRVEFDIFYRMGTHGMGAAQQQEATCHQCQSVVHPGPVF